MSVKVLLLLLASAGLIGAVIGYVFRLLLTLSRKGSIEVEIKQILLDAREEAKKITSTAEEEAKQKINSVEAEWKEKEDKITRLRRS